MKHKAKSHKISNRLRKCRADTIANLLGKLPSECQTCRFNACECYEQQEMDNTKSCKNYKQAIPINDLIDMANSQNINLQRFAEDYGLKIEYLKMMLKSKLLFSYKYYACLCKRLHVDEFFDEFFGYEERFNITNDSDNENEIELENNISKSEVME